MLIPTSKGIPMFQLVLCLAFMALCFKAARMYGTHMYEQGIDVGSRYGFAMGHAEGLEAGKKYVGEVEYCYGFKEGYEDGNAEGFEVGLDAGRVIGHEEGHECAELISEVVNHVAHFGTHADDGDEADPEFVN